MDINRKPVIINATVLLTAAAIMEATLHDLGNLIAARQMGAKHIDLYHNAVTFLNSGLSDRRMVLVAASGPLVSLFLGFFFHFLCLEKMTRTPGFLFMLFLSAFGYISFFGSMIATPFFSSTGFGFISTNLGFPMGIKLIAAIVGALCLFLIIRNLMKFFVEMGTRETAVSRTKRATLLSSILLFPALAGVIALPILSLPVYSFSGIIGPICYPLALLVAYTTGLRDEVEVDLMNPDLSALEKINYSWVVFLGLLVLVSQILVFWY